MNRQQIKEKERNENENENENEAREEASLWRRLLRRNAREI